MSCCNLRKVLIKFTSGKNSTEVLMNALKTIKQGLENSYYRYRLPNTDGILPSEYRDFEIPWYPVTDLKAVIVIPYRLHPVYLPVTGTPWLLFTE